MATIKEYNDKIRGFKNTQKITKTMKMVAASKLRKAQEAQAHAKLYAQNIAQLISRIAQSVDDELNPLLKVRTPAARALIVIITSDKGLAGAFNNNANKRVEFWLRENQAKYQKIDISCCGKKGYMYFRRRLAVKAYYENVTIKPQFADAVRIGHELSDSFVKGDYDEVYLAYNQFFSPISQKTIFEKVLPIHPEVLASREAPGIMKAQYIFEPPSGELLAFLIPHFLFFKIYFALLENAAGEHGARMSAMESATKNATELIDRYTLLRNRARQAEITTELTEIITGAEALN